MGRPPSTDKAVTVSIRIPESVVVEVDRLAKQAGVSRSDWLRAGVLAGVQIPMSPAMHAMAASSGPSVASGSVETLIGEPAAPVSPLAPPTVEGVFIANPVTEERTRPEPPPYQPNYDLIGYADRRQKPPREPEIKVIPPNPNRVPCKHPRWRRLGGVCLSCGEPVKRGQ